MIKNHESGLFLHLASGLELVDILLVRVEVVLHLLIELHVFLHVMLALPGLQIFKLLDESGWVH